MRCLQSLIGSYMLNDSLQLTQESLQGLEHVKNIAQDLRHFSRIDDQEKSWADINEGLKTTLRILQHEIKQGVHVEQNFSEIPKIFGFPGQLNQVFMNLILNALQAMEGSGTIRIETHAIEGNLVVRISDDGPGMSEATLLHLFTPFFTTKEVGQGTGLGLSISYNIIQKHGGQIYVESQLGKGTKFTITLPVNGPS